MTKSIYDQITASGTSGTDFKQRVVETFSGDALDTNRWFSQNIGGGSCTVTMADSVDGGLLLATVDGSNSPSIYLGFDNVCQYNPAGFRFISTCKKNDDLMGIRAGIGSSDASANPAHQAMMSEGSFVSSRALTTNNGGSYVDTYASTPVALSQTEFMYDIVGTSSSVTLTLDGVTEITKTTALPTAKCQPLLYISGRNNTLVKTWNCKYMECYNT
jgi:hypothetical protein